MVLRRVKKYSAFARGQTLAKASRSVRKRQVLVKSWRDSVQALMFRVGMHYCTPSVKSTAFCVADSIPNSTVIKN